MEKKDLKEIQQLINIGKEKGFLTYEEVNDALPDDLTSPEQLDDVLSMFDQMDIEVVSEEGQLSRPPQRQHRRQVPATAQSLGAVVSPG